MDFVRALQAAKSVIDFILNNSNHFRKRNLSKINSGLHKNVYIVIPPVVTYTKEQSQLIKKKIKKIFINKTIYFL